MDIMPLFHTFRVMKDRAPVENSGAQSLLIRKAAAGDVVNMVELMPGHGLNPWNHMPPDSPAGSSGQ